MEGRLGFEPEVGMSMGPKTVENYADDINKCFVADSREKGSKKSASQTSGKLFDKYPVTIMY